MENKSSLDSEKDMFKTCLICLESSIAFRTISKPVLDMYENITKIKINTKIVALYMCKFCLKELKKIRLFIRKCMINYSKLSGGLQISDQKVDIKSESENTTDSDTSLVKEDNFSDEKNDASFICDYCDKFFSHEPALKEHIQNQHLNCNKEILPGGSSEQSEISPKVKILEEQKCKVCHKIVDKSEFKTHVKEHLPPDMRRVKAPLPLEQRKKHICEVCSKIFLKKSNYDQHMEVHTDVKSPCQYCGKMFKKGSMDTHIQRVHTERKPLECPICHKKFKFSTEYKYHQKTHEPVVQLHVCGICNKSYLYKRSLKEHIWSHTGEKPYKCDNCDMSFRKLRNLKHHNCKIHNHVMPYACKFCYKKFLDSSVLKRHMKICFCKQKEEKEIFP